MLGHVTSKKRPSLKLLVYIGVFVLLTNSNCAYEQFAKMREDLTPNNSSNEKGKNLLLGGNINEAIAVYALLAQNSTNATLIAEYAYALALGGIYDAALINLDRIGNQTDASEVSYFTAQVFALMGYDDIAAEFWKPSASSKIPAWIALNSDALSAKYKCSLPRNRKTSREELIAKFKLANELVTNHSYLQSIALFHEIIDLLPNEYLPYAGYSVSLEKVGALEKSAQMVEKALTLVGDHPEDFEKKQFLENRLAAIKGKTVPLPTDNFKFQKNVLDAKHPQMMAYGGGMIAPSSFSLIVRIGRFVTDKSNVSCNLGITNSSDGGTLGNLGLSYYDRYHAFIYGVGLTTSGNNWSIVYSGGVSLKLKKLKDRTIDIFLDFNQGLSSGSPFSTNISFGVPFYFGTRK
jgi:tetratricopeptide (TPR) repeat protein